MHGHDTLIHFLIESILGKYMKKYIIKKCCYPVVIGGTSVANCIHPKTIKISDIDIVFVSMLDKQHITEENRFSFLNDIINDPDLIRFCEQNNIPNLNIDKVYETKPEYKRMVAIKLVRLCVENHPLIDTSIQHVNNNRILGKYPIKKSPNQYIPYVTKLGINWATCEYVKIDTMRILLHYIASLHEHRLSVKRFMIYVKKIRILLKIRDKPNLGDDVDTFFNMLHQHKSFVTLKNKLLNAIPDAADEVIII